MKYALKAISVLTFFNSLFHDAQCHPKPVRLVSVHIGANPLYGYYAAAPVYRVAVDVIRARFPESLGNLTHTAIYLPGYDLCPESGDHIAQFFMANYFMHPNWFDPKYGYTVIVSPECSNQALVLADLARELNLPLMLSIAGNSRLTNRRRYPTTSQVAPLAGADVLAGLQALLEKFSWRTVCLVSDTLSRFPGMSNFYYALIGDIKSFLTVRMYTWTSVDFDSAPDENYLQYMVLLKEHCRIVVILTLPSILRKMMIEADRSNMTSGDYAFLTIQPSKRPGVRKVDWRGDDTESQALREAYQSVLVLTETSPDWSKVAPLTREIQRVARQFYNYSYPDEDRDNDMQICIYEATMMFAQLYDENYPQVIDMSPTEFIKTFNNRSLNFVGRNFSTNKTGSKINHMMLLRLNRTSGNMEPAIYFNTDTRSFYSEVGELLNWWPGRSYSDGAPPDRPPCGFVDHDCSTSGNQALVGAVTAVVLMLILLCIAIGFWWRKLHRCERSGSHVWLREMDIVVLKSVTITEAGTHYTAVAERNMSVGQHPMNSCVLPNIDGRKMSDVLSDQRLRRTHF